MYIALHAEQQVADDNRQLAQLYIALHVEQQVTEDNRQLAQLYIALHAEQQVTEDNRQLAQLYIALHALHRERPSPPPDTQQQLHYRSWPINIRARVILIKYMETQPCDAFRSPGNVDSTIGR